MQPKIIVVSENYGVLIVSSETVRLNVDVRYSGGLIVVVRETEQEDSMVGTCPRHSIYALFRVKRLVVMMQTEVGH